ncbi:unnamed protein product (mitochondrion) [Plasmodiophora brassicae]|uniref:Uncharacterized protein n=1 Tax=Plasmodiophora brassicae TaxID=37360 RepID=A0A3P3Y1M7_PLABS|nr:unnamed protein product [Plasmodiophora brassicae]
MDRVQEGRRARVRRSRNAIEDALRRGLLERRATPDRAIGATPSPLLWLHEVSGELVAFIMEGHRMFRPELVDEALHRGDGDIDPGLLMFYEGFLTEAQIATVRRDLVAYAASAPDDVFGLDPNRYPQMRPGQVVKFDNPIGKPLFVFPSRVEDDRVPAAKMAICVDATGPHVRYDFLLDDAALSLWGYTAAEMEALQRAHFEKRRDRRPDQKKCFSFFMSLFSPASASVIATVNLVTRYFLASNLAFEVEIRRRDGRTVPAYCTMSSYVHNFYAQDNIHDRRTRMFIAARKTSTLSRRR